MPLRAVLVYPEANAFFALVLFFAATQCAASCHWCGRRESSLCPQLIHRTRLRRTKGLDFGFLTHCECPVRGIPTAVPRNRCALDQVSPANCAADASGGLVPHRGHSCSTQRMAASVSLIESKTFSSPDHKPLAFMN